MWAERGGDCWLLQLLLFVLTDVNHWHNYDAARVKSSNIRVTPFQNRIFFIITAHCY